MSSNILEWAQSNREKLKLLVYFVLIVVLSVPVTGMIGRGWQDAKLAESLIRLGRLAGVTLARFSLLGLGMYLGFLTLMTVDQKKRVQATLLWIATIVTLVGLSTQGVFLPNVEPIENMPWLAGGFVGGILLGGREELLEVLEAQSTHALEFRTASRGVYYLIALTTVVMFLELHLEYPNFLLVNNQSVAVEMPEQMYFRINSEGIFGDILTTSLFLVITNQFIKYDADHDFFILGPPGSGKSLFLIGAYNEIVGHGTVSDDNNNVVPHNPSPDLVEYMGALQRQDQEWILSATGQGEVNRLSFQYVHGSVFPTNIQLSSLDYAGEYLQRLPDALTGVMDDDEMDSTMNRLIEGIEAADTLILVIDVERFMDNQPLEIGDYFPILEATDSTNALIVATKADLLAQEFKEERGLEPNRYFDEFRQYSNDRLQQNENVMGLVAQVGNVDIHPVYYQTKETETGDRVPMRDANGGVVTVGFDELLEVLGRQ